LISHAEDLGNLIVSPDSRAVLWRNDRQVFLQTPLVGVPIELASEKPVKRHEEECSHVGSGVDFEL
jgi:hypothetical protein